MHDRHDLTDVEWEQLEPLLPERTPRRVVGGVITGR
jgi:transposase